MFNCRKTLQCDKESALEAVTWGRNPADSSFAPRHSALRHPSRRWRDRLLVLCDEDAVPVTGRRIDLQLRNPLPEQIIYRRQLGLLRQSLVLEQAERGFPVASAIGREQRRVPGQELLGRDRVRRQGADTSA